MSRRLVVTAAGLAVTSFAVVPAQAQEPPLISIDDVTVVEPNHPDTTATVHLTVSLDEASAEPVTVAYDVPAGSNNLAAAGQLTFAPGDLSEQVPVVVTRDTASTADSTAWVTLSDPDGAAFAEPVAHGDQTVARGRLTVLNSDKLGAFACRADGAHYNATGYAWVPVGKYGIGGEYPIASERIGWVWRAPCEDASVQEAGWTHTLPGPDGSPAVSVAVEQVSSAISVPRQPVPGDTRPFVGDGADATSRVSRVTIAAPEVTVVLEGLWAAAHGACTALDTAPAFSHEGGVGTMTVNGLPVTVIPDELSLGVYRLVLNSGEVSATGARRSAANIVPSVDGGNVSVHGWAGLAQVTVHASESPCSA